MAGAAGPPSLEEGAAARIRNVEVERQFHILRTAGGEPRWDLDGDALERACADPGEGGHDWIRADHAEDAKAAVLGLLAVRAALAAPGSPLIRVRCSRPRTCLDRALAAGWIEPFDMSALAPRRTSRCGAARRYRCQLFILVDIGQCQVWHLELESEWTAPYRPRSATFLQRGAVHHCPAETE